MQCCGGKKTLDNQTSDHSIDLTLIDPSIKKYKGVRGALITVLQEAQEIYGYLPMEVLNHIARETKVKPAKVYGVVTFYTQFRLMPVGEYLIMLCQGTACHVNGSKSIEEAISKELNIKAGETTEDNLFTFNNVACLGCCSLAPVMMINGETYPKLTPDSVREILRELRKNHNLCKEV